MKSPGLSRWQLRWRLARWIAPEVIMADPCPGREAFVVQRSKPGTFPAVQMTVALDQLNIEVTSQLPKIDESDKYRLYNRHRRVVTVTGSAES